MTRAIPSATSRRRAVVMERSLRMPLAAWPAKPQAAQELARQQRLDCFQLVLQFLKRHLELGLSKRVELQARHHREIPFAVEGAGVTEYQSGGHAVLALGDGRGAHPIARRRAADPRFDVVDRAVGGR